jgi:hypothetical protein
VTTEQAVAPSFAARKIARLLGTLCGVGLLTLVKALLRPSIPVLIAMNANPRVLCGQEHRYSAEYPVIY